MGLVFILLAFLRSEAFHFNMSCLPLKALILKLLCLILVANIHVYQVLSLSKHDRDLSLKVTFTLYSKFIALLIRVT